MEKSKSASKPQFADSECGICLNLMVEPAKVPCGHYFCIECLEKVLINNRKCPFCRKDVSLNFQPKIDVKMQQEIAKNHPTEYKKRVEELKAQRALELQKVKLVLQYGNTHREVNAQNGNSHDWTAFVKSAHGNVDISKFIEQVEFKLHPTFHNPVRICKKQPYKVSCLGWGTFWIPITIYWKPELEMGHTELNHYLSFNGEGEWHTVTIEIEKEKLEKLEK